MTECGSFSGKRVALIVPLYNVENFIEDCLRSIQNQDYLNFKVFVVNDGSTDLSESIVQKFVKSDNRFILINQKNGGVGFARNVGLSLVDEGGFDYVAFVDGDDLVEESYLSEMLYCAVKNDSDLSLCSFYNFTRNGRQSIKGEMPDFQEKILTINEYVELIYTQGSWRGVSMAGGMVWRGLFKFDKIKGLRFTENKELIEDELFSLNVASRVSKIVYINRPLYGYRQRQGSLVRDEKFLRRLFDTRVKALPLAKEISERAFKVVCSACVALGLYFYKSGYKIKREELTVFRDIIVNSSNECIYSEKLLQEYNRFYNNWLLYLLEKKKKNFWKKNKILENKV